MTPVSHILDRILSGDRTALAQAITLVESSRPDHNERARELIEACLPHTGKSIRLGITGVPGVGKSTFIEALGMHIIRERGEQIAVLAIDPSSPLSGGSILGDKTRMPQLGTNNHAFIRPSPSGGSSGGVAAATREAILLCEAAGFQNVLVETIGVGQSEVAVASMVDFFLVLMLAGAGDELQGIKRGVLELADLVAFNKVDGDNRIPSEAARRLFESVLSLFSPQPGNWKPPVVTCSARTGDGIAAIWSTILDHRSQMTATGHLEQKRRRQARHAMHESIRRSLTDSFIRCPEIRSLLPQLERDVMDSRTSPIAAAQSLIERWKPHLPDSQTP
ncbi:MAG TPA: methylmalonyl Co-A mutase-associated GTPase MeaB [Candidatus Acidoferrales bacterium]|nr:methylmalonyl Co-A mutase-associated GTPase MeaB [Candidatus Acidoferrales bacterium]